MYITVKPGIYLSGEFKWEAVRQLLIGKKAELKLQESLGFAVTSYTNGKMRLIDMAITRFLAKAEGRASKMKQQR